MNTEPGMRSSLGLSLFDDDESSERSNRSAAAPEASSSSAGSAAGTRPASPPSVSSPSDASRLTPPPPPGAGPPPFPPLDPCGPIQQLAHLCEPSAGFPRAVAIASACATLLTATSLYSEVGHAHVLAAVEAAQSARGRPSRFTWLVEAIAAAGDADTGHPQHGTQHGTPRSRLPRTSEEDDFIRSVSIRPGRGAAGAQASRRGGAMRGGKGGDVPFPGAGFAGPSVRAERAARVALASELLILLNALIGSPAELGARLALRAELVGLKLLHVLAELRMSTHVDLIRQVRIVSGRTCSPLPPSGRVTLFPIHQYDHARRRGAAGVNALPPSILPLRYGHPLPPHRYENARRPNFPPSPPAPPTLRPHRSTCSSRRCNLTTARLPSSALPSSPPSPWPVRCPTPFRQPFHHCPPPAASLPTKRMRGWLLRSRCCRQSCSAQPPQRGPSRSSSRCSGPWLPSQVRGSEIGLRLEVQK